MVIRLILSRLLSLEANVSTVLAESSEEALSKAASEPISLAILSLEAPYQDGLKCAAALRKSNPNIPILVLVAATDVGVDAAFKAIGIGVSDYVTKASSKNKNESAVDFWRSHLLPKIKALIEAYPLSSIQNSLKPINPKPIPSTQSTISLPKPRPSQAPAQPTKPFRIKPISGTFQVLAIAVSTGGPNALTELLSGLPNNLPVPILIVQHMGAEFTPHLADRLNKSTPVRTVEASAGMVLEAGTAYLAPGNFHMVITSKIKPFQIGLNQNPPENSCRPSADPMFRSVAKIFGKHTLSLVLTGMGQDGLVGAQAIKESGGSLIAQDQESCVVWGMPGAVTRAGLVDEILPLNQIAGRIRQLFNV
jgi:two-component system, chemotaxis family, protein-glutamate methylesterase/glutaminase